MRKINCGGLDVQVLDELPKNATRGEMVIVNDELYTYDGKSFLDVGNIREMFDRKDILKPCPFCGGHAVLMYADASYAGSGLKPQIFCRDCSVEFSMSDLSLKLSREEMGYVLVERWNARCDDA